MTPRRRSALLGISALSLTLGAAGCERQVVGQPEAPAATQAMPVYADKAACAQEWDQAACDAAFQKASAEHEANAPKYATRAECEAAIGAEACQEGRSSGGGSFFMPMMMGMMMGQMMSGRTGYPVYTDRNGAAYSGGARVSDPQPGAKAGTLPRTVMAPVTADGALASRGTTTRGGFGRTSSYRGSAGA